MAFSTSAEQQDFMDIVKLPGEEEHTVASSAAVATPKTDKTKKEKKDKKEKKEKKPKHEDDSDVERMIQKLVGKGMIVIMSPGSLKRKRQDKDDEEEEEEEERPKKHARLEKPEAEKKEKKEKHELPEDIVYFGSGCKAPYYMLSNFSSCPIRFNFALDATPAMRQLCPELEEWIGPNTKYADTVFTVPSSEHLYQALYTAKCCEDFLALLSPLDGITDVWTESFLGAFGLAIGEGEEAEQERHRQRCIWSKKSMVGAMAKWAVKPANAAWLGLDLRADRTEDSEKSPISAPLLEKAWADILDLKFRQNPTEARALMGTAGKTLVEFYYLAKEESFWTGKYDYETKRIVGANTMGKFMMAARDRLIANPPLAILPASPKKKKTEDELLEGIFY